MSADEIREVRASVIPAYLDELLATVEWGRYRVVGFTSTFQQNVASFALARRIKKAYPEVVILFGGANADGPMAAAWLEAVPWIDLAVSGEADHAFPALLCTLCAGGDPLAIPGVVGRRDGAVACGPSGMPLDDLDEPPILTTASTSSAPSGGLPPALACARWTSFRELTRCWWGEKATCRFCGLNGSTMAYRAKSPRGC
jgi:radical SAM superfamily enzyme YgiQ (UPF0313 family)